MLRKTIFAIAATTAIGAAAFLPTVALAGGGGGGHHHGGHGFGWGHGFGYGAIGIAVVEPTVASCWQSRLIETRRGTLKRVLVNICD
jgi:hypothetical protein